MSIFVLTFSILLSVVGVVIAVQTLIDTRREHYEDYLRRKNNE